MNKENYKNVMNQIHASDELKNKTFEKIEQNSKKHKNNIIKICSCISACVAVFLIVFFTNNDKTNIIINIMPKEEPTIEIANLESNIPKFKNIEELKEVLKEQEVRNTNKNKKFALEESINDASMSATDSIMKSEESNTVTDYSSTNVQVQGVDEADIVKTDGNYIYYVTNNNVYIVSKDNLEIVSIIKYEDKDEGFIPYELYLNNNKMIVIGNAYKNETIVENNDSIFSSSIARINSSNTSKAIVYNVLDKENPVIEREVAIDGYYNSSRMIGDNCYIISNKTIRYYKNMNDVDILPMYFDSINNEEKIIECTDIAYFGKENYSYTLVGGFNINNEEEINVESFFGAGDLIYCSEKNLYLTQRVYEKNYSHEITNIYKFALDNSKIELRSKGEVKGYLNSQFSMDEYNGNLRVATTIHEYEYEETGDSSITSIDITKNTETNSLYILDENLKEIGKIENLAQDEKIYSVRFIGKIGYIVTFKQVDPLFVIDLSNPENPEVKGELKIPGYSSYLHPYDENHIIGIGYNTKDNGYGGVKNSNMKMSMFDVSDLENPKEIFNVNIGGDYAYSEILYNHKSLFYKKSDNLIGFPVTYRENNYRNNKNAFVLFKINLENNEFEKYGEIAQKLDYRSNIKKAIYIDNTIYTLSELKICSYDIESLEKNNELIFEQNRYNDVIIEDMVKE